MQLQFQWGSNDLQGTPVRKMLSLMDNSNLRNRQYSWIVQCDRCMFQAYILKDRKFQPDKNVQWDKAHLLL